MRLFALLVVLVLIPGITLTLHFALLWHTNAVPTTSSTSTTTTSPFQTLASDWELEKSGSPHNTTTGQLQVGLSSRRRPAYNEIPQDRLIPEADRPKVLPAFAHARVINDAKPWFTPRKLCKETCCVEMVAISLDQDDHKIINTKDGRDLSDLTLAHRPHGPREFPYFARTLTPDVLPCLLPGTILQIDNHGKDLRYFWNVLRPHIKVPYVLITSGSDADSPQGVHHDIGDPLLLKWYGTNPKGRTNQDWKYHIHIHKFQPLPLGLSFQFPQEKMLQPYLEYTNYTNPFLDMTPWDTLQELDFGKDVLVHFSTQEPHQKRLWKALCPTITTSKTPPTGISCNPNAQAMPPSLQLYRQMSPFRFGIVPRNLGWDSPLTYELLLLGVIPIIQERSPWSQVLYEGLPVIQVPHLDAIQSREQLQDIIYDYLDSDTFQNATFQEGWDKLFLRHSRRQLLKDAANRHQEILRDPQTGLEYYQGYQYSIKGANGNADTGEDYYCERKENCQVPDQGPNVKLQDMVVKAHRRPKLDPVEQEWLETWRRM